MRRLAPDELRFSLRFGLGQLPRSTLRDMQSRNQDTRDRAIDFATERMLERFDGHEVLAPDPAGPH